MGLINKNTIPLKLKADIENALADLARKTAEIEYIAMMTDVDLEGEDDEQDVQED